MARRIVAIVNPVSGARDRSGVLERVRALLSRGGVTMDVQVTRGAGDATVLARDAADADAILVVGGDGTVCEVVNGIGDRRTPIAILPTGTENLVATELGMGRSPGAIVAALLGGRVVAYDVGRVNGRRFLAVVGMGFDAECVLRMSRVRRGHITQLDYIGPIVQTFVRHTFPSLRVEADGQRVFEGRGLALVGMIGRYASHLDLFPHARCDNGLLDLCVFPCATRWRLMVHAIRVLLRRHMGRGGVVYRQCRQVTVEGGGAVPFEVDGDVGGWLPVECTVVPGAARFLVPGRSGTGSSGDVAFL